MISYAYRAARYWCGGYKTLSAGKIATRCVCVCVCVCVCTHRERERERERDAPRRNFPTSVSRR
jgi:hypothetical protein